jgi:two-component system nitrogen regulation response regulator GlnG
MHGTQSPESGLYERVIREVEIILIKKTIQHAGDIHTKAAKILGINRNTLRKKIKELGIE